MANFRQLMKCWLRPISDREWEREAEEGEGVGVGFGCRVSSVPEATVTKTHKQT